MKTDKKLRELLSDNDLNEFTMLGLRDSYEARYGLGECHNSSELRKWIYRRVMSLVKKGYLTKNNGEHQQAATYLITDHLRKAFQLHHNSIKQKVPTDLLMEAKVPEQLNELRSKLNQYQVDMLAYAGECKEYQQLAVDYPHLKDRIEPMFRNARERSSELMGQLRAINNLLKQSELTE